MPNLRFDTPRNNKGIFIVRRTDRTVLLAGLGIVDFGGNEASVSAVVEIP